MDRHVGPEPAQATGTQRWRHQFDLAFPPPVAGPRELRTEADRGAGVPAPHRPRRARREQRPPLPRGKCGPRPDRGRSQGAAAARSPGTVWSRYAGATIGFGPEFSRTRNWRWKCEIELMPPTLCARRLSRLGPNMTIHPAAMMTTRTTGINSSTYLPCRKTLTTGNSIVVDGRA